MGNAISTKIVIDGEKEYREVLKNITQAQKELGSEMKLNASKFKDNENSLEALTEKHKILTKQLEIQKDRVKVYTAAIQDSEKKEEEAKKRIELLTEQYEKASKEMQQMKDSSKASEEELKEQKKNVEKLSAELDKANDSYTATVRSTYSWQTSLNNAQADLTNMEDGLQKNEKYMSEAEKATDGCAKSIDAYGKEAKDATEETKNQAEAMEALGTVIATSGIKEGIQDIVNVMKECTDRSKDVETAFKTATTLFGEVDVDSENLSKRVRELTKDGTNATEIYGTLYQAMSAGIDATEDMANATNATDVAVKASIAGLTTSTNAIDVLTTIINTYNLSAEDATHIADELITVQNKGKTTLDELGASYGKTASSASAYKINMENVNAGYIALTKNGIATAEAGTYMASMFKELGDAGSDVSGILQEETGKTLGQLMEQGYSIADLLGILYDSTDQNAEALMNLWSSAEAGKASNAIVSQGLESFNNNIKELTVSTGTLQDAYDKMTDSMETDQKRFEQASNNMKQAVGDVLNPALREAYQSGTDLLSWATDFIEENPDVVAAIIALTTGVAVLGGGLTILATVQLPAVQAAVATFTTAMMSNPFGLLAVGVTALTAAMMAFVEICPKQESEVEKAASSFKELKEQIDASKEAYKEAKEEIVSTAESYKTTAAALIKLNQEENKSATTKKQIAGMVATLNDSVEGLNLSYDEQNDKLSMTNLQLRDYVEYMDKNEQYTEDCKRLNELLTEQESIQTQLTQAKENYNKELNAPESQNETPSVAAAADAYGNMSKEMMSATGTLSGLNEELDKNKNEYDELKAKCDSYTNSMEQSNDTVQEGIDVSLEYNGTIYTLKGTTQEVADTVEGLKEVYTEAKLSAEDSIRSQVGLFEELKISSDLTVSQMAANLDSQTLAYTQYTDDLNAATKLMNESTDPNFKAIVQNLASMNMDGAGYLHELVTAAQGDSEEFQAVMEKFGEMEEARNTLTESLGSMTTGYAETAEKIFGIQTQSDEDRKKQIQGTADEITKIVTKGNEDVVTNQTESLTDMNKVIIESTPVITESIQSMATSMIKSANSALGKLEGQTPVFREIGKGVMEDMADGISSGSSAVSEALTKAVNAAVDSMDTSGLAEKIDKKLGEAFS